MTESTLRDYDDIWPVVIRQTVTDNIVFGTPFVMMTDETTLLNRLRSQISIGQKYGVISDSKTQMVMAFLTQDRRRAIISEVIHCPARKWNSKQHHDDFMISMMLRAYFQREDTFNWSKEKVIQWFKGGVG